MTRTRTRLVRAPHPSLDGRAVMAVLWAGEKPPRWWFHGLLAVPALSLLWSATRPEGGGLLAFAFVVLFALVWAVRLLVYAAYQRRLSPWFAVAPLAGALLLGVLAADLPLKARWAYAQGAFESYVRALPPRGETFELPGRLGGFTVQHLRRTPEGVIFTTADDLTGEAGFAWFPNPPRHPERYEPLAGAWYSWRVGTVD